MKRAPSLRFVLVTLDHHVAVPWKAACARLQREMPGLELSLYVAADWEADPAAAEACRNDIASGDIVVVTQIFLEDHAREILDALRQRAPDCRAMVCAMCAPEVMRATRMGSFSMGGGSGGRWSPGALLKRLRGKGSDASGERQMKQLRRIPRLLRWIPGTAQDVRAYYLVLQYWLAASEANLANLVRFLVERYGGDAFAGAQPGAAPAEYPETGLYHPDLPAPHVTAEVAALPKASRCTVGVIVMRSYVLAGDTRHYDAVIRGLEARGMRVLPVFASGLDARPAIRRYFLDADGKPAIDALVSLTGFSLVGGPAYRDAEGAAETLAALDVPYLAAQPLELQTVGSWETDSRGLSPLEATLMVAIPELDGATGPLVFGGKSGDAAAGSEPIADRAERLADRVARWVELRAKPRRERHLAIVLFNFPPNGGAAGTAAYLSVWKSLWRTLRRLDAEGYRVEVPDDVDALRRRVLEGNASFLGAHANVHARVPTDEHVRNEPWLDEIEAVWGSAPGRLDADGTGIRIHGERFGNVFVGLQPAFGYEGDPMRLLFEGGFAPTHAFSAFYRWLRTGFGANAVLHFGTHGALEFMPGKQVGLSDRCWPDRLIGDLPNLYLYASNNPSEGTLAKRRSAATLISYLTPPITQAGLYRGLLDLRTTIARWSAADAEDERTALETEIRSGAAELDLDDDADGWDDPETRIARLRAQLLEVEYALIPNGLHVVGEACTESERVEMLTAASEAMVTAAGGDGALPRPTIETLVAGDRGPALRATTAAGLSPTEAAATLDRLATMDRQLATSAELDAVIHALDGGFIAPAPGGDVLRNPDVLPTGRNLYGFDPFAVPSRLAQREGALQAERLLESCRSKTGELPDTVAMVLWGTDNMKSDGVPLSQALALVGARARFDAYGRLVGAELIPLAELGRPRIDVLVTLSGIFRDLLPLQVRLLAEAFLRAAQADEPPEMNFVRAHTMKHAAELGCDLETAAMRVFSNREEAYGANVNMLVESSRWSEEDELAETWVRRKSHAYGAQGASRAAPDLMRRILADTSVTFQNLESVELGVSDVDQYVDGLGGLTRAATRERGEAVDAWIGDLTRGQGTVRTLNEQIALETRTRTLNPRWYEAMLSHGYEGVRQIEARVTTTLGWSATTATVPDWVYQRITETFVLDPEMRDRLASLNSTASARLADRLLEAESRSYWSPDEDTLRALQDAADDLQDRLEGILPESAA